MRSRKKIRTPRRTWTRHPATRVKPSGKVYRRPQEKKVFEEKEFVGSVWKTMQGQAKENPEVALLHERLDESVKLVGLSGGIASGKSAVAAFLKKSGIPVIDADAVAREVVRPGRPAYRAVLAAFGEGLVLSDKTIDRQRLGEIVFKDESKRRLLESITHPEILREIALQVRREKKKRPKAIVVDAALLFESGLDQMMHKTLLVRIDPKVQLARLMARDRLPEIEAWRRVLAQMPSAEKEKRADFVIDNSGSFQETQRQVLVLLKELA